MPEKPHQKAMVVLPDDGSDLRHMSDRMQALAELGGDTNSMLVATEGGHEVLPEGSTKREAAQAVLTRWKAELALSATEEREPNHLAMYDPEIPQDVDLDVYLRGMMPRVLNVLIPIMEEGLLDTAITKILDQPPEGRDAAKNQIRREVLSLAQKILPTRLRDLENRINSELRNLSPGLSQEVGTMLFAIPMGTGAIVTTLLLMIESAYTGAAFGMAAVATVVCAVISKILDERYRSLASASPDQYQIGMLGLPEALNPQDIIDMCKKLLEWSNEIDRIRAQVGNVTLRELAESNPGESVHLHVATMVENAKLLSIEHVNPSINALTGLKLGASLPKALGVATDD